ncbi:hypothetical protein EN925_30445 [Mesorhizobium sp. M7A.F.Ca.US.006.04.2.1]|uniref:hypothetical protein n=1 Tax=unclassified Mesorhizobium TaxID=325217 RepID=UPI000FCA64C9|nr:MULTISPECIES: hypothetical protein [unclassified Mesorhizobium]RUX69559.1 hypothetical protein EN990_34280 [Mesorhizobium sp. M7A.F.Ca.US.005.03.1.1]RUY01697.1 hypothetical protein EN991_36850 [Mesorhizobium sp. M7A.F.Ca.US.005.03.2.1]RUY26928.1 hypothetical protein EN979_18220 [Mesorhizobium sp. M7A.F.Ca.US.001.04.2.1]RUY38145.1 hypothetical protein EN978_24970 [Mesorhizobium sp. M7A.F.Ca.US.001.04.1.1]RVA04269.1 hypothetical protein EN938_13345 [Mesorhizobium sp. M7A.F.Ca.US.001.02.1.1]
MFSPRLTSLIVAACSLCAIPSFAAESSYVYCDNGLRCFKAPCPSNSVLDLATGTIIKGMSIDTSGLPRADKAITDLSDALYAGKIVVRGSIEHRTQTITGKEYDLPWLVATSIVRTAMDSERKHCSSR